MLRAEDQILLLPAGARLAAGLQLPFLVRFQGVNSERGEHDGALTLAGLGLRLYEAMTRFIGHSAAHPKAALLQIDILPAQGQ